MAVYSNYQVPIKENTEEILNEAYFGRTPELLRAQEVLGRWRKKYMTLDKRFINSAQSDPLHNEFCEIMAKCFGFSEFYLVLKGDIMANGYTYGQSFVFSQKNSEVTKTRTGYKWDGTPICLVYVYNFLIFDPLYTDDEIMALILHEVGHNFSTKASTIINVNSYVTIAQVIIEILLSIANPVEFARNMQNVPAWLLNCSKHVRQLYVSINKTLNSDEQIALLVSLYNFLKALPSSILFNILYIGEPILKLLSVVINIAGISKLLTIPGIVRYTARYTDERIADQFAAIYGYGPEQTSVLNKLTSNATLTGKMVHKTPIGWINDLVSIPCDIVNSLFDEHPTNASRRANMINYLKQEMKKDGLSPQAIKSITEDIERFEKDTEDLKKNISRLEGTAVRDKYNIMVSKLEKGDDLREYLQSPQKDVEVMDRLGESTNLIDEVKFI